MKKKCLFPCVVLLLVIISACAQPINQVSPAGISSQIISEEQPTEIVDGLFLRGCIKDISLNGESVAILTTSGRTYLWGKNDSGMVGNGTTQTADTPYLLPIDKALVQISTSNYNSIAVTESGNLYAWGKNEYGEFGSGTYEGSLTPQKVMFHTAVNKAETTGHLTFVLTVEGDVYQSGWNLDTWVFEMESPDISNYSNAYFTKIDTLGQVVDFAASSGGAAFQTDIAVFYYGLLSAWNGDTNFSNSPVKIDFPSKVLKIDVNESCVIALCADQKLYGFGSNITGIFGPDLHHSLMHPTVIYGFENITDFSLGNNCLLAITDKGTILGAGYNIFNQITATQAEPADSEYIFEPFEIILDDKVTKVFCGYVSSAAITESGDCYLWGANYYNQLLNHNTNTPYTKGTPVRITTG